MSGLTHKVSLKEIIQQLFRNEKYKATNGNIVLTTFAQVTLTQTLVYPAGFNPLGVNIYFQVDTLQKAKEFRTSGCGIFCFRGGINIGRSSRCAGWNKFTADLCCFDGGYPV